MRSSRRDFAKPTVTGLRRYKLSDFVWVAIVTAIMFFVLSSLGKASDEDESWILDDRECRQTNHLVLIDGKIHHAYECL